MSLESLLSQTLVHVSARIRGTCQRALGLVRQQRKQVVSDNELYILRFRLKDIIQERVYHALLASTGPFVRHGPFQGMSYAVRSTWGDPVMKLLGLYEACLHPTINSLIQQCQGYSVIDLGCAEGYYAAGLARLLHSDHVIISDISKNAITESKSLISLNCPTADLSIHGKASREILLELLDMHPMSVIVCDIEGGELELFDCHDVVKACKSSYLIIELHEFCQHGVGDILSNRFSLSHKIRHISESDLAPSDVPELRLLPGLDRALSCCESRPELMEWLYMVPSKKASS